MHGHRALAPPVAHSRRGDGGRARAGRERLPRSALPDGRGHIVWPVDSRELHVRPVREALVVLDRGAEPEELVMVWRVPYDGVRIADSDRHHLVLLAVDVERLAVA